MLLLGETNYSGSVILDSQYHNTQLALAVIEPLVPLTDSNSEISA